MNVLPLLRRVLPVLLLATIFLFLFAAPALAASSSACFGGAMYELVSDRSKILQISVLGVALGILILWKR
jgi:hypothetical protein